MLRVKRVTVMAISATRFISRCLYPINELRALNAELCHALGRPRYIQPFIYFSFFSRVRFYQRPANVPDSRAPLIDQ
jgi:hypothetical protein